MYLIDKYHFMFEDNKLQLLLNNSERQINVSIAKHKEKIWCAYRTRNLDDYDSISELTELSNDFRPLGSKRLIAENNHTAFEDVRLFSVGELLMAFYTFLPNLAGFGYQFIYSVGFGLVDVNLGVIKNQISLRRLSKRIHEKNWVPYIYNDELFLITDFDPFLRVIKLSDKSGKLVLCEEFLSSERSKVWKYGEVRGGTPLIANPNNSEKWLYG
ncbi:MAG: hypothetical protein JWR38_218 [Mucilaginibacter sp.]|nr:hypothetical protein [Mucilaginibacter sp.]